MFRDFFGIRHRRSREKKTAERETLYIIFPSSHHELCLTTAEYIHRTFKVTCVAIEYRENNKKKTFEEVEKFLRVHCILIVGYKGRLTPENCYKLGIAHGHMKQVILVNLSPIEEIRKDGTTYYLSGVPKYVRRQFLITYPEGANDIFLISLKRIIPALIGGNSVAAVLYQKALNICEGIENDYGYFIEKIDDVPFIAEIESQEPKFINSLLSLYVNDDERLTAALLFLIAKKEREVFTFLSSNKGTQSISQDFIKIENNFVFGDQVKGNKVNNDLSWSRISNFSNEMKDNAQQHSD